MKIQSDCLICGLEDELTECGLLHYPRACLIWKMAGGQLWRRNSSNWLSSLLEVIQWTSIDNTTRGGR